VIGLIPRNVHGVLDYLMGFLLIGAPFLLGFSDNQNAAGVAMALGATALVYSVLTNYELGIIKVIPFRGHLVLDFMSGALLAASPWLLGFADYVIWPHVTLGVMEMGAALMTSTAPYYPTPRTSNRAGHAM
jgi:hypothetical protein